MCYIFFMAQTMDIKTTNLDYERPVKIADGTYWVGFYDSQSGMHCNPYLIVDGDEAVLLDGGSRPDFPTVMMKILQTGINPSAIKALIYHHYDPDLCGSLPNFEDIIGRSDLKIISDKANHWLIKYYYAASSMLSLEELDFSYRFASGRELKFIMVPYAHVAGNFITFDTRTGVLFTSDLFGSYSYVWDLFLKLSSECGPCKDYDNCPNKRTYCPFPDILSFHKKLMPSERVLRWAVEQIAKVPFTMIAPQHGSIIYDPEDMIFMCEKLVALKGVGIDGITGEVKFSEIGDISHMKERLART